jgi:hypothetical protein
MDKFVKDPAAVLDYTWDWSDYLVADERIATHEVLSGKEELVIDSTHANDTEVTAWISGGLLSQHVFVTCRIVTNQGRTEDRSIYVWIANT